MIYIYTKLVSKYTQFAHVVILTHSFLRYATLSVSFRLSTCRWTSITLSCLSLILVDVSVLVQIRYYFTILTICLLSYQLGFQAKKKNAKKQQQHLFDPEDMTYESSHRCSVILISLLILSIICTYFFFIICLFSLIADKSEHIFASHPHISSSTLRAL